MNVTIEKRQEIWSSFLQRWPSTSVATMSLSDYSNAGSQDSFCYWLEKRTEDLGSIWGGSSFKFGVYARKDKSTQENERGKCYSADFGWMAKYGVTPDEAFERVRIEILKVVQGASEGDLEAVDVADLGEAVKWKIAFLYQSQTNPCVLPIFKADYLRAVLDSKNELVSSLHKALMHDAHGKGVLAYGDEVWAKVEIKISTELTPQAVQEYLADNGQFVATRAPSKFIAGYRNAQGQEIAVVRENRRTTLFLSDGPWLNAAELAGKLEDISRYPADRNRNGNLSSQAPTLAMGNAAVSVVVPTLAALIAVVDAYDDASLDLPGQEIQPGVSRTMNKPALNQILYGAPGTGKTYRTINETLRILDPIFLSEHRTDRVALKAEFDRRLEAGDVRFVTFHQSFSYEDFVEGLRAESDEDGKLRYEVVDGVFKRMCAAASTKLTLQAAPLVNLAGRKIWKMSLGNTLGADAYIYDECIENGYALLGYGDQVDFSGCKNKREVGEHFKAAGYELAVDAYAITAVSTFLLNVSKGDLVVVTDGNHKFRAIGEFVGDYEVMRRENPDEGYGQCRKVRWLRVYEQSLPHELLMNKAFSQATIYQLHKGAIDHDKLTQLLGSDVARSTEVAELDRSVGGMGKAKVLIIDEINRGNISRIFGELITLIETSKRAGNPEALTVTLPYSKESFSVPANLYLIGTMNTTDRSLAGLDIALRRRFDFTEMLPQADLLVDVVVEGVSVEKLLRVMNERIEVLLDREHCLGHAYFMPLREAPTLEALGRIFKTNVLPLLQEYFFEDWQRIRWVLNDHRKKDESLQFVQQSPLSVHTLFGSVEGLNEQIRWRINKEAFGQIEAYAGTVAADGDVAL